MLKRKTMLKSVIPVAASALLLSACGSSTSSNGSEPPFDTVKDGVLTVAPYSESAPVVTRDGGKLGALTGDLLNGFAKKYGLKVELQQADFAGSLAATQQRRADVTPYIYYTPERAKTVYYSAPDFVLPTGIYTLNSVHYKDTSSLHGMKVGGVVGQVWEPYLRKKFGDNAKLFQTAVDAETALVNGQIDAYVNSNFQMLVPPFSKHSNVEFHPLSNGDLGMPSDVINTYSYNVVSCQNSALAKAMDKYLKGLVSSGKWKKIYDKNNFPKDSRLLDPADIKPPKQGCGS